MASSFNRKDNPFAELISAEAVATRVAELGAEIAADHHAIGSDLVLLGVLKGSFLFLADLCRQIPLPLAIDFIGIASYGDETASTGVVKITSDLTRQLMIGSKANFAERGEFELKGVPGNWPLYAASL